MAKVKFLRDFRGIASAEQFYEAGTVVDLPEWQVAMLLAEGAVALTAPTLETGVVADTLPAATPAVKSTAKRGRPKKAAA